MANDLSDLSRTLDRLATGKQTALRNPHRTTDLEPTAENLKRAEAQLKEASPDEKEELLKWINNTRRTLGMKDYEDDDDAKTIKRIQKLGKEIIIPQEKEEVIGGAGHLNDIWWTSGGYAYKYKDKEFWRLCLERKGEIIGYNAVITRINEKYKGLIWKDVSVEGYDKNVLSEAVLGQYESSEGNPDGVDEKQEEKLKGVKEVILKKMFRMENDRETCELSVRNVKDKVAMMYDPKRLSAEELDQAMDELKRDGLLFTPREGKIRRTECREHLLPRNPNKVRVHVTEDLPAFMGVNSEIYWLRKGDVLALPKENAEILLRREVAEIEKVEEEVMEPKEPWQITKDEWMEEAHKDAKTHKFPGEIIVAALQNHKRFVREALREGKPVPTEVLADYPELVEKEEAMEKKKPWEMTKDEIRKWDFPVPEGGASKTPKTVFSWKKEDYETLYDLSKQKDQFRFNDVLGKGWEHEWKSMLHLKPKIIKNQPITIYRATEYDYIIPGSYVSESLEYAKGHLETILRGKGKILSAEVKPSELMIYGDPHEFIYIPESAEAFHKPLIQKALKEGKPVPAEVLEDYPELMKEELKSKEHKEKVMEEKPNKGEIEAIKLKEFANVFLKAGIDEAVIDIRKDGWYAIAVNPANTRIAEVLLSREAWKDYSFGGEITIGLGLERLYGYASDFKKGEVIEIVFGDTAKMEATFYLNGTLTRTFKLLDPKEIRERPKKPELEYETKIALHEPQVGVLRKVCGRKQEREVMGIGVTELRGKAVLCALFAEKSRRDCVPLEDVSIYALKATASNYTQDYIADILSLLKKDVVATGTVTLEFGYTYPLCVRYDNYKGMNVTILIAPRIEEERETEQELLMRLRGVVAEPEVEEKEPEIEKVEKVLCLKPAAKKVLKPFKRKEYLLGEFLEMFHDEIEPDNWVNMLDILELEAIWKEEYYTRTTYYSEPVKTVELAREPANKDAILTILKYYEAIEYPYGDEVIEYYKNPEKLIKVAMEKGIKVEEKELVEIAAPPVAAPFEFEDLKRSLDVVTGDVDELKKTVATFEDKFVTKDNLKHELAGMEGRMTEKITEKVTERVTEKVSERVGEITTRRIREELQRLRKEYAELPPEAVPPEEKAVEKAEEAEELSRAYRRELRAVEMWRRSATELKNYLDKYRTSAPFGMSESERLRMLEKIAGKLISLVPEDEKGISYIEKVQSNLMNFGIPDALKKKLIERLDEAELARYAIII